jgi:hypothetical protein
MSGMMVEVVVMVVVTIRRKNGDREKSRGSGRFKLVYDFILPMGVTKAVGNNGHEDDDDDDDDEGGRETKQASRDDIRRKDSIIIIHFFTLTNLPANRRANSTEWRVWPGVERVSIIGPGLPERYIPRYLLMYVCM